MTWSRRLSSTVWCLLLPGALSLAACADRSAEATLRLFFEASRLRDLTTLASFAVARFEPHIDGAITHFDLLAATPAQTDHVPRAALAVPPVLPGEGEAPSPSPANLARLSLSSLTDPLETVLEQTGNVIALVRQEMTIHAQVHTVDGQTEKRTLKVTLARAESDGARRIVGRWIVTNVSAASARSLL